MHFDRVALVASMLMPMATTAALAQATVERWTPQELARTGATPEFLAWLAGKGKNRKFDVERNLREQVEKWPIECKEMKINTGWTFGILDTGWTFSIHRPVVVNASGDIESGVWREGYDVTVCGIKRQLNIVYIAQNSVIKMVAGMPGSSHADPILQRDAGMAFYPRRGKNCDQAFALDTKFIEYTDPAPEAKTGQPQRSWREDWTLWACGKEIVVPFTFTPNARGTQWSTVVAPEKP